MENNKIDRVIEAFRRYIHLKEEGIVNAVGTGGYTGSGDPLTKGGFDPVMAQPLRRDGRRKRRIKTTPGQRVRWRNS